MRKHMVRRAAVAGNKPETAEKRLAAAGRRVGAVGREPALSRAKRLGHGLASLGLAPATRVQRELTIKEIDYDPKEGEYRHGYVDQGAVFEAVKNWLRSDKSLKGFANQWSNVKEAVEADDYSAPDVPGLVDELRHAFVQTFTGKSLMLGSSAQRDLEAVLEGAIAGNIGYDYKMDMEKGEEQGFDRLIQSSDPSRAKGTPSQVTGNLSKNLATAVGTVRGDIQGIRQGAWTVNDLTERDLLLDNPRFETAAATLVQDTSYREPHTNQAGWLPDVDPPVNHVAQARQWIYGRASGGLKSRLLKDSAATKLDLDYPGNDRRNRYRDEYRDLYQQAVQNLDDNQMAESTWGYLGQSTSGYFEFHTSDSVSRLVYEPMGPHEYLTAHYKWRGGYNPFFEL